MIDLKGKRGLVVGIANEASIAYGCARAYREAGAELALTYLNEKAAPYVLPLAQSLQAQWSAACDVRIAGQLEAVFERIAHAWGRLDFLLHSIAYAPKEDLHGPLWASSGEGFAQAMDVSCHSFIRMARLARPLMTQGGSLVAVSFHGAQQVVPNYNMMGPVKAALEASVRTLAVELAPQRIHVHGLSTGPVATRAASGLPDFDELIAATLQRTPGGALADIDQIGQIAAFLASPAATPMTGEITYADNGFHVTA
ncbi:MAG: Enoyl-[acyl-carrier-protein] reductase [NADH] FabI [Herbaspirillum frisingense]|uniref:Enoyl-[acyl-carrier-protein] reductase [NADH] n=1 Tax=Herbaspirillum frisingense TaxID=92645 RepID=A0A7V8FYE7_9BURK|nr:MAG: Enoyl-[acyl-carrier-protein] reductase [NADH] FabI [Herbaspirillum frisingense]